MDFFNLEDRENAIIQIQRILRSLDFLSSGMARVRLSGTYDDETRAAVVEFQKNHSLPPTGVVDKETWDTLQAVSNMSNDLLSSQRPVYILPKFSFYPLALGLKDTVVYVIQHFLNTLRLEYDEIGELPFTGELDEATEKAIRLFQRKNLLDETGIVDNATFNALASEYERINSREY
ncbi:MAG: peptidoglycan-binding protein [Clostridia bacterium]|nr:peptidoglycan-binding protein [Clostridia bacterium]